MPRNLDRRVEAITPILDPEIAKDLQEILGIMLADNRQAWELQPDASYVQRNKRCMIAMKTDTFMRSLIRYILLSLSHIRFPFS